MNGEPGASPQDRWACAASAVRFVGSLSQPGNGHLDKSFRVSSCGAAFLINGPSAQPRPQLKGRHPPLHLPGRRRRTSPNIASARMENDPPPPIHNWNAAQTVTPSSAERRRSTMYASAERPNVWALRPMEDPLFVRYLLSVGVDVTSAAGNPEALEDYACEFAWAKIAGVSRQIRSATEPTQQEVAMLHTLASGDAGEQGEQHWHRWRGAVSVQTASAPADFAHASPGTGVTAPSEREGT